MQIACFGGAHVDTAAHLMGPAIAGTSNPAATSRSPGGVACNVARFLSRLGVPVMLCSLTGEDAPAASLRSTLETEGVDTRGLESQSGFPTASYTAVLEPDGSLVMGLADMEVYDSVDVTWAERAARRASAADLWLLDTNLPDAAISHLVAAATAPVLADPVSVAKAERLRPVLADLTGVFPDRAEAAVLGGHNSTDHGANAASINAVGPTAVVSLGADGAHEHSDGGIRTLPAVAPERVADVTGAGDALLAGYAFGLLSDPGNALSMGLAAASLAVEAEGSAPVHLTREALLERAALG